MFKITSESAASQSFKTVGKRLKAASEKENCYFKTYIKKNPIEYENYDVDQYTLGKVT